MLGPSIMVGSTPLALGYSLYARTRVSNRPLMYAALGLAIVAALFTAWGIIALTIDFIRR
jgi:hypothetical protein